MGRHHGHNGRELGRVGYRPATEQPGWNGTGNHYHRGGKGEARPPAAKSVTPQPRPPVDRLPGLPDIFGCKPDRQSHPRPQARGSRRHQLLQGEAGSSILLDGSPAGLASEQVLVKGPLFLFGHFAGQEGNDGLLRTAHG